MKRLAEIKIRCEHRALLTSPSDSAITKQDGAAHVT